MQCKLEDMSDINNLQAVAKPDISAPILLAAVTSLQVKHMDDTNDLGHLIQQKMPGVRRPSAPDRLFQPTYQHPPWRVRLQRL